MGLSVRMCLGPRWCDGVCVLTRAGIAESRNKCRELPPCVVEGAWGVRKWRLRWEMVQGWNWTMMAHGGIHRPSCSVCGLASSLAAVAAIITPHNQAMSLQDGIHSAAAIVLVLGGLLVFDAMYRLCMHCCSHAGCMPLVWQRLCAMVAFAHSLLPSC